MGKFIISVLARLGLLGFAFCAECREHIVRCDADGLTPMCPGCEAAEDIRRQERLDALVDADNSEVISVYGGELSDI